MNEKKTTKNIFSVKDVAGMLGYSRQHVLRLIHAGKIKAEKVGEQYIINAQDLPSLYKEMTEVDEKLIDQALKKVLEEYSDALRKLGDE